MSENERIPNDGDRPARELRALATGPPPPPDIEERIVAELRARGLLGKRHVRPRRLLAAAAALAIFLVGASIGRWSARPAPSGEPPPVGFALFLLGGAQPADDETARVEEYRSWAIDLATHGELARGEKLAPSAWRLFLEGDAVSVRSAPISTTGGSLSGFFLLTTDDLDEALAVARSCPHLRHGGEVLLRPIEPT